MLGSVSMLRVWCCLVCLRASRPGPGPGLEANSRWDREQERPTFSGPAGRAGFGPDDDEVGGTVPVGGTHGFNLWDGATILQSAAEPGLLPAPHQGPVSWYLALRQGRPDTAPKQTQP